MYVIKSGKIRLSKKIQDSSIVLEELGAGGFCGEIAMVSDQPRPLPPRRFAAGGAARLHSVQLDISVAATQKLACAGANSTPDAVPDCRFGLVIFRSASA